MTDDIKTDPEVVGQISALMLIAELILAEKWHNLSDDDLAAVRKKLEKMLYRLEPRADKTLEQMDQSALIDAAGVRWAKAIFDRAAVASRRR